MPWHWLSLWLNLVAWSPASICLISIPRCTSYFAYIYSISFLSFSQSVVRPWNHLLVTFIYIATDFLTSLPKILVVLFAMRWYGSDQRLSPDVSAVTRIGISRNCASNGLLIDLLRKLLQCQHLISFQRAGRHVMINLWCTSYLSIWSAHLLRGRHRGLILNGFVALQSSPACFLMLRISKTIYLDLLLFEFYSAWNMCHLSNCCKLSIKY